MKPKDDRWLRYQVRWWSGFCLLAFAVSAEARETVTFPSGDGLLITADTYIQDDDRQTPFIVLFHQAGWSRGEYLETAPRLNAMGFNCMAVDQRSGGSINGVTNETNQRASTAGKATEFLDAIPDMLAAIAYAKENLSDGALIGMGSSYSSALILKLAGDDGELTDGVASFSPGENFSPSNLIRTSAANLSVPVFITSRRNEQSSWQPIYDVIPAAADKSSFLPSTSGQHGSRALWPEFSDSESYWEAYEPFLQRWLPSMASYRAENGLAEDGSEDSLIPEGSSVSHLMRYALGGEGLPELVEIQDGLAFQFGRLKNRRDVIFSIEVNGALDGNWSEVWSSVTNPYGGGTASSERISVLLSQSEESCFVRLWVSLMEE